MLAAHNDKERGGNATCSVIKKWIEKSGLEVPMSSPEALTNFIRAAIEKWLQMVKEKIEML